uniref:Uncharacterized protein n=1 Tax=Romanomermis culicivorax TaxID=13658 RepID=A0A915L9D1_ROMCU
MLIVLTAHLQVCRLHPTLYFTRPTEKYMLYWTRTKNHSHFFSIFPYFFGVCDQLLEFSIFLPITDVAKFSNKLQTINNAAQKQNFAHGYIKDE